MRTKLAVALVVGATIVWGATFPVVKSALADAGPLTFLALRFSAAAALLAWHLRPSVSRGAGLRWAVACGVALYWGYLFQTWGLLTTTPARSAFITALSAVVVPLIEPLVGLSRFSVRALGGAVVATAGLAILLQPGDGGLVPGDLLTVGCAVAFTFHTLLLNRAVRERAPASVNAVQVGVVALLALPSAGLERWSFTPTVRLGGALLATAVLATVAAFWAMAAAQRALTAAQTGVILAFEPVAAAVTSIALGQDRFTAALLLGGVLVVSGVVVATTAPGQLEQPPTVES